MFENDSPQRVGARNRRLVLDEVWRSAPLTRSELGACVGLAKSTIKEICDGLIADVLLEEVAAPRGIGRQGRPALQLRVSSQRGYLLGIDIGADKVISRVATLAGETLATVRTGTGKPSSRHVLKVVRATVESSLAEAGVTTDEILTTVVGTPGVVAPVTGIVTLAPQIDGWERIRLASVIADALNLQKEHVVAERQSDLATLAEARYGAAKDAHCAVYVHLGIGIGGGIIIDGELYRGAAGAAGEIGYLPHSFGDLPPPRSGVGAWEWAAGGRAFARHGRDAATDSSGARLKELAGGKPDQVSAEIVFAAAHEGDRTALRLVRRLVHRIAVGIASVVCVLNPEYVIVAGGISRAGDLLVEVLEDELKKLVPVMPQVRLSSFADEGAVTGAIHRAGTHTFDRLCPVDGGARVATSALTESVPPPQA
jgi:predicted NBD/HSP70 family sugar kinase